MRDFSTQDKETMGSRLAEAQPSAATISSQSSADTDVEIYGAISGVSLETNDLSAPALTRSGLLSRKAFVDERRTDFFRETKRLRAGSPEKNSAYKLAHECADEAKRLEAMLLASFIPQHGLNQLISPRAFFVSPLFRVGAKQAVRHNHVELVLHERDGQPVLRYRGPEIRQSDGLVFTALLHMVRDVRAGALVSFRPEDVCIALFGRYDGNSRRQLREHLLRLQGGLVIFEHFSVQLCQRFDYPSSGRWTVALDENIVNIFKLSSTVWLDLKIRLALPEGLATWLYGYVQSQTKLIPTKLDSLRRLCGSSASEKAFMNRMRDALHELVRQSIIDRGWSLKAGMVRWMKARHE